MFELLFLAFFSNSSESFLTQNNIAIETHAPQIEILEPAKVPQKMEGKLRPKLLDDEKVAILAMDLNSGKILFEQNAHRPQNIASLTKLLTYRLLRENHQLDDIVMVPEAAIKTPGAGVDLLRYEKLSLKTLLEALLIPSANDAAVTLAVFDAGSEEAFVKKMNAKAHELGLQSGQFVNASGLDVFENCDKAFQNCDHIYGNKMSAFDLAKLTRIALRDDFFRTTVAEKHFYGTSVNEQFFHEKKSTNVFLSDENQNFIKSKGVKTGYTELAGQCFINLSENEKGDEILTVILGSRDRFGETQNLISWILDSFDWR